MKAPESLIKNHDKGEHMITVDGNYAMFLVHPDGSTVQYISALAQPGKVRQIIKDRLKGEAPIILGQ